MSTKSSKRKRSDCASPTAYKIPKVQAAEPRGHQGDQKDVLVEQCTSLPKSLIWNHLLAIENPTGTTKWQLKRRRKRIIALSPDELRKRLAKLREEQLRTFLESSSGPSKDLILNQNGKAEHDILSAALPAVLNSLVATTMALTQSISQQPRSSLQPSQLPDDFIDRLWDFNEPEEFTRDEYRRLLRSMAAADIQELWQSMAWETGQDQSMYRFHDPEESGLPLSPDRKGTGSNDKTTQRIATTTPKSELRTNPMALVKDSKTTSISGVSTAIGSKTRKRKKKSNRERTRKRRPASLSIVVAASPASENATDDAKDEFEKPSILQMTTSAELEEESDAIEGKKASAVTKSLVCGKEVLDSATSSNLIDEPAPNSSPGFTVTFVERDQSSDESDSDADSIMVALEQEAASTSSEAGGEDSNSVQSSHTNSRQFVPAHTVQQDLRASNDLQSATSDVNQQSASVDQIQQPLEKVHATIEDMSVLSPASQSFTVEEVVAKSELDLKVRQQDAASATSASRDRAALQLRTPASEDQHEFYSKVQVLIPPLDTSLKLDEFVDFLTELTPNSPTFSDNQNHLPSPSEGTRDSKVEQLDQHLSRGRSRTRSPSKSSPRTPKKQTGTASQYFQTYVLPTKSSGTPRKLALRGLSSIPFPRLDAGGFGLKQELLADNPFQLLLAVMLFNQTRGEVAYPVFLTLVERWPLPEDLAAAKPSDVVSIIRKLGLQNNRTRIFVELAKKWVKNPPQKDVRYRTLNYPFKGAGKGLKASDIVCDEHETQGAWEIAHLPGCGDYAIDSWRIFCRDVLRGVAQGYNGEGASPGFQPEWQRVLPKDKELRAFLKWMWLREGWNWNPYTGEKDVAFGELLAKAQAGELTREELGFVGETPLKKEAKTTADATILRQAAFVTDTTSSAEPSEVVLGFQTKEGRLAQDTKTENALDTTVEVKQEDNQHPIRHARTMGRYEPSRDVGSQLLQAQKLGEVEVLNTQSQSPSDLRLSARISDSHVGAIHVPIHLAGSSDSKMTSTKGRQGPPNHTASVLVIPDSVERPREHGRSSLLTDNLTRESLSPSNNKRRPARNAKTKGLQRGGKSNENEAGQSLATRNEAISTTIESFLGSNIKESSQSPRSEIQTISHLREGSEEDIEADVDRFAQRIFRQRSLRVSQQRSMSGGACSNARTIPSSCTPSPEAEIKDESMSDEESGPLDPLPRSMLRVEDPMTMCLAERESSSEL